MSSIEERVKKIVAEQLGVNESEVNASASFVDDLGADHWTLLSWLWLWKRNLRLKFQMKQPKR